ncbi:MAG: glycogen/starch synthase [Acidobacteriota bacterium]
MKKNMRVVLVTAEAAPFARAGKRAEFSAVLPKYLSSAGIAVSLVMPKYRTPEIDALETVLVLPEVLVPFGGDRVKAALHKAERQDFDLYLIDHPRYFQRENIYGSPTGDYLDNDERFIFFCRAALEFLVRAGRSVDIIHSLDWPTALVPVFLKSHYARDKAFRKVRSVFTLHSPDCRGEFPAESLAWTGLDWDFLAPHKLSSNGKINLWKAGLAFADVVTAQEGGPLDTAQPERCGASLREILKTRKDSFFCRRGKDGWRDYPALYEKALSSRRGG